ncbi:hypothetical protein AB433_11760 [Croceicoccus naphthovorans]|uniref:Uncharacterized protein n=1 Tax=Croceicoccus naphthovorans TaxID=1348774 RepID=A0A0G3XIN7_9SPHN|nr:hypothetical protein AB433_11760 [Croceicoccus naphthovorans]
MIQLSQPARKRRTIGPFATPHVAAEGRESGAKEGKMHLPHAPDYNLRWITIIGGMAILLVAFVVTGLFGSV